MVESAWKQELPEVLTCLLCLECVSTLLVCMIILLISLTNADCRIVGSVHLVGVILFLVNESMR